MEAHQFLQAQTLLVLGLGFIAISLDTVVGVLFGKLMCLLTAGKINPLDWRGRNLSVSNGGAGGSSRGAKVQQEKLSP